MTTRGASALKKWVILGLGLLLVAEFAVLIGGGIATGAVSLSVTNPPGCDPTSTASCAPVVTPYSPDLSGTGALTSWVQYAQANVPVVSSALPSDLSTSVSFGLNVTNLNGGRGCGSAGDPTFDPGGVDPLTFSISFSATPGGTPTPEIYSVNGAPTAGVSAVSTYTLSPSTTNNYPSLIAFCIGGGTAYGTYLPDKTVGPANGGPVWGGQTVQMYGQVGAGWLTISATVQGTYCSNFGGNAATGGTGLVNGDCGIADQIINAGQNGLFGATAICGGNILDTAQCEPGGNGNWKGTASVSIPVVSGIGALSVQSPPGGGSVWFNGQTIVLDATTGYAGSSATPWALSVDYPSARGGANTGWKDTAGVASPVGVANFITNGAFSFVIPAGASANSTIAGYNIFQASLYNAFTEKTVIVPIDISPRYEPGGTNVTIVDVTSGYTLYPAPNKACPASAPECHYAASGDTVAIQLTSYSPNNAISSWELYAFYFVSPDSPTSPPPCGGDWLTACGGQAVLATATGLATYSGTYTLTSGVQLLQGASQLGFAVLSQSPTAQSGNTSYGAITIFNPGPGGGLGFWANDGPVLTVAIVTTGAVLLGVVAYGRGNGRKILAVAVPVAMVAIVVVLYANGALQNAFLLV